MKPIISGKTDESSSGVAIVVAMVAIPVGLPVAGFGLKMLSSLSRYSSSSSRAAAITFSFMGLLFIMSGIILPFAARASSKNSRIDVYEDHIEGKGMRCVGSSMTLCEFNEPMNNISSVSIEQKKVVFNLNNGSQIKCSVGNGNDVANAVRALLNK